MRCWEKNTGLFPAPQREQRPASLVGLAYLMYARLFGNFHLSQSVQGTKIIPIFSRNTHISRSRIKSESCSFRYVRVFTGFLISMRQSKNHQSSTEPCRISSTYSLSPLLLFTMTHFLDFLFSDCKSKHFDTLPFPNTVCQKIYKDGKSRFLLSNPCRQPDHFHPQLGASGIMSEPGCTSGGDHHDAN